MKVRAAAVLRGLIVVGVPLVTAGAAQAEFTGVTVDEEVVSIVDDPIVGTLDLTVFTLIASFDAPGDQLIAVAGTPDHPLDITITNGSFWNHPLTEVVAPLSELVVGSPAARYDSFVDIGQETNEGSDPTVTPPAFVPGLGSGDVGISMISGDELAWARIPDDPLTEAFGESTFPGNGQILIGRFSVAGTGDIFISGNLVLLPGDFEQVVVSFTTVPAPGTLALIGLTALVGRRRRRARR